MKVIRVSLFVLVVITGCEKPNPVVQLIDKKSPTEVYEIFGKELFLKNDMKVCEKMDGECEALLEKAVIAANKNGYTDINSSLFTDDVLHKFLVKIKASPDYKEHYLAQDINKNDFPW